ncbi:hypothetical protein CIB84_006145 [Bambusicola thoracicus]|uniref:TNFR-Cys domain-containing protein n=1 Tax=Bambusicola thoracicus TaxID=9083 RepID=A0A2P4T177_BAMTH|nr:hypothetical protein CIB84_006145 [Bambusicola thoracicus]
MEGASRTDSTDTECKPCPPGTFSDEESYDTSCIPHTVCKSVAVAGNNVNDTVCHDSVATALPHTAVNLLPSQSSTSSSAEIITRPVILNSDMSYIIGELLTRLQSLLSGWEARLSLPLPTHSQLEQWSRLIVCTVLFQPFSPTEKQCDKKVRNAGSQTSSSSEQEEQHLLETPGSSSSSLDNAAGSERVSVTNSKGNDKKESFQQRYSATEGCKLHCGDRHSSASSGKSVNKCICEHSRTS